MSKKFNLNSVNIYGQEESEIDEGIYPSDHYAIVSDFYI